MGCNNEEEQRGKSRMRTEAIVIPCANIPVLRRLLTSKFAPGGVAQLVEHLHGMQGVRGSNPLTSTNKVLSRM
jgi:hypothetical protein